MNNRPKLKKKKSEYNIIYSGGKKKGLPPGSLYYIGPAISTPVKIHLINYTPPTVTEKEITHLEECIEYRDRDSVSWFNIEGVHDVKLIEQIGKVFELHGLLLEDVMNTHQRPKADDYDDHLFVVLRMLMYDESSASIKSEQISIVLSKKFVISFQQIQGDLFDPIRQRIRDENSRLRIFGNDYLFYRMTDVIVDQYFLLLEKIGERIDDLEQKIMISIDKKILNDIQLLRKDLLLMRRSIYPLREVLSSLSKDDHKQIQKRSQKYFRDVYDHTVQVIETLEMFREMSASLKEAYQSQINMQMNRTIQTLTLMATIFIPLTFIAGIYGMNFDFMPELHWRYGYFYALGLMVVVGAGLAFYFKKRQWF